MNYVVSNPNKDPISKLQKYLQENNFKYERHFLPKTPEHESIRFSVDLREEDILVLKIIFPKLKITRISMW